MPAVYFINERKTLDVLPGTNLRKVSLQSGIPLFSTVGRVLQFNLSIGPLKLFSASDIVQIEGKGVNARSEEEENVLSGRFATKYKITSTERLASQVTVTGDIVVRTRTQREIDAKLTREQRGYIGLLAGFTLMIVAVLALVGLDLIKML